MQKVRKLMKTRMIRFIFRSSGPILLLLILQQLDWEQIARVIQLANPLLLTLGFLMSGLTVLLKLLRQQRVLKIYDIHTNLFWNWNVFNISNAWGTITPGRLGEATRVAILKNKGLTYSESTFVFLGEKVLEFFIMLVATGSATVLMYFSLKLLAILIFLMSGVCLAIFVKLQYFRGIVRAPINWVINKTNLDLTGKSKLIKVLVKVTWKLSLLIYLVNAIQIIIFAESLRIHASPILLIACYGLGAVVSVLPISVSGIGTREIVYISILGSFMISKEKSFSLSLIDGFASPILTLAMSYSLYIAVIILKKCALLGPFSRKEF